LPEGIYPIVEATLYLASAPKSNSAGAYFKAVNKVEAEGKLEVPQHLQDGTPSAGDARDPSAGSGQALGLGEGYVYPHEEPGHHVRQQYLPTALLGTYFYSPFVCATCWATSRPKIIVSLPTALTCIIDQMFQSLSQCTVSSAQCPEICLEFRT
jgi:hypothetical protein